MSGIPDSSLFDIAPQKEIVVAGGKRHEIIGVPFGVFLRVGRMWPPLIRLLTGSSSSIDNDEFAEAPEAVSRFIAAGFGFPDNQQAIDKAASLPLDIQMDLFSGILKATLGGGGRPFAGKVNTIVDLMATGQGETSNQNSSPDLQKPAKDTKEKVLNAGPKPLNASSRPAASPQ